MRAKEGRYVGDIIAIPTGGTTPGWFTFYLLISAPIEFQKSTRAAQILTNDNAYYGEYTGGYVSKMRCIALCCDCANR